MRFIRSCHAVKTSTKRSRRAAVSRETGVRASALARSVTRSGRATCGLTGRLAVLAAYVSHEQRQRRRGDAIDAAGMADGSRPVRLQLVADFVRQAGERRKVDVIAENEAFIAPIGFHVGRLAAEIHGVF